MKTLTLLLLLVVSLHSQEMIVTSRYHYRIITNITDTTTNVVKDKWMTHTVAPTKPSTWHTLEMSTNLIDWKADYYTGRSSTNINLRTEDWRREPKIFFRVKVGGPPWISNSSQIFLKK